jgi:hypothetical protein
LQKRTNLLPWRQTQTTEEKVMTDIKVNGGRYYGDVEPAGIEVLIEQIKTRTLNPVVEKYYQDRFFSTITDKNGEPTGEVRFWGSFADDPPHAFDLRTDDPALIQQLKGLINANVQSEAYVQAKRAAGIIR